MAEFSTEAELSIILPGRETASIRSEIEDALSDIPVGVDASSVGQGANGTQGGGSVRAIELGLLRQTLVAQRASADFDEERNEILNDILDELEAGGAGGGGGRLLPFTAGAAAAGGGGGIGGFLGGLGGGALASGGSALLRRGAGTALIPGLFGRGGLRQGDEQFPIEQQQESLGDFLGIDTPIFDQDDIDSLFPEITVPDDLWPSSDVIANEINFEPLPAPDVQSLEREDPLERFQPDRPDQTAFEIQRRRQTRTDRLGEESLAIRGMQMDAEIRDERLNDDGVLGEVKREFNNTMNDFADNLEREIERTIGTRVSINWRDL